MHIFFHFLLISKGKGILILPIMIMSAPITIILCYMAGVDVDGSKHAMALISGASFYLMAALTSLLTKNYKLNAQREKIYYEEEAEYIWFTAGEWIKIFLVLGTFIILGAVADIYKLI